MAIFIICMVAVVLAMGTVGGIYILGLKDAINEKDSRIKKLESDLDWWEKYCDDIVAEKTTVINTHENRLKELEEQSRGLLSDIEKAYDEVLKKESEYNKLLFELSLKDGMDETEAMKKIDEANAIRIATKDLDFPPVDKVDDDISDAVSKFLNRQAKKEE